LDTEEKLLSCEGQPVALTQKAFEMLYLLVRCSGHVVEREEFIQEIWPDTFVEEGILTVNISLLRKALGDSKNDSQYIETVPRRGYRFVARVKESQEESLDLIVEEHSQISVIIEEREESIALVEEAGKALVFDQRSKTKAWLSGNRMKLVAALVVVVLAVAIYLILILRPDQRVPQSAQGVRSIAVLPFKPMDAGSRDEAFELGMADTLITRLSHLRAMTVRPTSAVRKYMGLEQDSIAAGREQRVDLVVEGSIQRSGDMIRVTIRLMNVKDGSTLWAYKCDQLCTDIFQLQDSISEDLAQALMLKLTDEEEQMLTKRYTKNKEAYELYLRGRFHFYQTLSDPAEYSKAMEYFKQAINIEPSYALAYAGLADSATMIASHAGQPHEYVTAIEAAKKALELDDTLAEAHTSLAMVKFIYLWDWAEADKHFKRAIELNPNYPQAHNDYGFYLVSMGQFDEGIAKSKRSLELDPVSIYIIDGTAASLYLARRYDEVIEVCRKGVEIKPGDRHLHSLLSGAFYEKGMYNEALAEYIKGIPQWYEEWLGKKYAEKLRRTYEARGWKGIWQVRLDYYNEQSKQGFPYPYGIGALYALLGEKDQAFEWLERAYKERADGLIHLKVEPVFDSLRSDPRFADLLRRMGFPP
jgi:serine/threonine-protein kinase